MNKYFIEHGNYVHMTAEVLEFVNEESAVAYAYEEAKECGWSTLDSHGFEPLDDEEREEMTEEEISEVEVQFIEEECVYTAVLYVPEKHDDYL